MTNTDELRRKITENAINASKESSTISTDQMWVIVSIQQTQLELCERLDKLIALLEAK